MNIKILHEKIDAITPITGVSIGHKSDKSTWRIQYINEPNEEQLVKIQSLIDSVIVLTEEQKLLNEKNIAYLSYTDGSILAHLEEMAANVRTTLTDAEFKNIVAHRIIARNSIAKEF